MCRSHSGYTLSMYRINKASSGTGGNSYGNQGRKAGSTDGLAGKVLATEAQSLSFKFRSPALIQKARHGNINSHYNPSSERNT